MRTGPGTPTAGSQDGGAHGGIGGDNGRNGTTSSVYGSFTAPVNIGSGSSSNISGGGAIRLTVSGLSTINGTITANGQGNSNQGNGSGGSVYITSGTIAGTGNITTNGGSGSSGGCK